MNNQFDSDTFLRERASNLLAGDLLDTDSTNGSIDLESAEDEYDDYWKEIGESSEKLKIKKQKLKLKIKLKRSRAIERDRLLFENLSDTEKIIYLAQKSEKKHSKSKGLEESKNDNLHKTPIVLNSKSRLMLIDDNAMKAASKSSLSPFAKPFAPSS